MSRWEKLLFLIDIILRDAKAQQAYPAWHEFVLQVKSDWEFVPPLSVVCADRCPNV